MSEYVFLDGQLVESEAARVGVHDAGLLHAVGLFDTMRSYGGRIFRLEDHLDRLFYSAGTLGITISQPRRDINAGLEALLEANHLTEARVRLTVTRGSVRDVGDEYPPQSTLVMTAGPMAPYPPEFFRYGMTVIVSPFKQNPNDPTAGHKTLSYFGRLIALQQAQQKKAGEALWFTPQNRLAQACISNVFLVHQDRLLTPGLDSGVLPGITRKAVLELAEQNGIDAAEKALTVKELLAASEVFLTNSIMEIMPVCRIEGHKVGDEKPGPVFQKIRKLYLQAVETETP